MEVYDDDVACSRWCCSSLSRQVMTVNVNCKLMESFHSRTYGSNILTSCYSGAAAAAVAGVASVDALQAQIERCFGYTASTTCCCCCPYTHGVESSSSSSYTTCSIASDDLLLPRLCVCMSVGVFGWSEQECATMSVAVKFCKRRRGRGLLPAWW